MTDKGTSSNYEIALKEALKKKPDFAKTFGLLNEALTAGDARAAYALGTWYLHGTHVRKNRRKAVKLLKVAAEARISDALYDLAVCYEKGAGVKKDLKRAYELYVFGALWGDDQSVYEVGRCLYYGIGTRQDRQLSKVWYERAGILGVK